MIAAGLSDADLHALVDGPLLDGPLDTSRRADLLRRAAASPRDRDLVETWQDQGEWIRAAFAGVEHEPLPPALDLGKVRQLHAVPFAPLPAPVSRARRWRGTAATLVAMTVGLAGSWYVAMAPASAPSKPADEGFGVAPPPTSTIPDLSRHGYAFVGAERSREGADRIVFHYRKGADERIDLGARDASDSTAATGPAPVSWSSGGVAWTMSGSPPPERLRALAADLRRDDPSE